MKNVLIPSKINLASLVTILSTLPLATLAQTEHISEIDFLNQKSLTKLFEKAARNSTFDENQSEIHFSDARFIKDKTDSGYSLFIKGIKSDSVHVPKSNESSVEDEDLHFILNNSGEIIFSEAFLSLLETYGVDKNSNELKYQIKLKIKDGKTIDFSQITSEVSIDKLESYRTGTGYINISRKGLEKASPSAPMGHI